MTGDERALLREVFRWARAEGGLAHGSYASRWTRLGPIEQRWAVSYYPEDWESGDPAPLEVWRGRIQSAQRYWVASVVEGIDVLCALGILPPRFSSAYRAAVDDMAGAT